jgi:hypothetical protein
MSGIISLRLFVSGAPDTTKRFSLTENEAKTKKHVNTVTYDDKAKKSVFAILTLWLPEVDDRVVVLEHVHFVDVLQLLHSYVKKWLDAHCGFKI